MNVLFVSVACSQAMIKKIFNKCPSKYGIQGQKFMNSILNGLNYHLKTSLHILSKYSNRAILDNKSFHGFYIEKEKDLEYTYLPESRFLSIVFLFFSMLYKIIKFKYRKDNAVIICDGLCFSLLFSTLISAKISRMHICVFVTDLPRFMVIPNGSFIEKKWKKFFVLIWEWLIKKADSFIVLTPEMNAVLNYKKKPYVIIEGLVDPEKGFEYKNIGDRQKVCIYAGSINKIYGIDKLVHAFSGIENKDYELHIFGGGDFEVELLKICESHHNIKFFGWKSHEEIVSMLPKVELLINPRPSSDEYTKYSFPSKTLEYMLSGTPFITTKLPCITSEYFEYLYFFDDETIEGMRTSIDKVLSIPLNLKLQKSINARDFILKNKNCITQTSRILELFKDCD